MSDLVQRLRANTAKVRSTAALRREAAAEIESLIALVLKGRAVVADFLPNVGRCALQDYARLNEFMVESAKLDARD